LFQFHDNRADFLRSGIVAIACLYHNGEIGRFAMSVTTTIGAMISVLALAQAAVAENPATPAPETVDVAFAELTQGRSQDAITRILANKSIESDDPAALINLGTAHLRMGRQRDAQGYYMAALASESRYDLQLADGRWMDSRRAARLAVEKASRGQELALR
jgi:hypothetical protein